MKQKINGIVVVEGKTDTQKLKSIFDVETIETKGSVISNETMKLIKEASKHHQIYLFLDPDGPGEKIRKKIVSEIQVTNNIFISKDNMKKNSKKIGIAEATTEAIKEAFKNVIVFDKKNNSLSLEDYNNLNLSTVKKRLYLCNVLGISLCNNKQLFKRLNMMNKNFDMINEIMKKYGE